MKAVHAKIVRLSVRHYNELVAAVKADLYTPKKREGFLVVEATPSRLRAKYFYPRTQKVRFTDPESLEPQVEIHSVLTSCAFTLLPTKGLIWLEGRRGDFAALEEALGQYQDVAIEFETIRADCVQVFTELRDSQDRLDLRALRIREYHGKNGLLTTANFKLMEPGEQDRAIQANRDAITGFTGHTMTDEGRQAITVSQNGSVRYTDGIGEDVVELVLGLLKQHHHEAGLESEVQLDRPVGPSIKPRKPGAPPTQKIFGDAPAPDPVGEIVGAVAELTERGLAGDRQALADASAIVGVVGALAGHAEPRPGPTPSGKPKPLNRKAAKALDRLQGTLGDAGASMTVQLAGHEPHTITGKKGKGKGAA